MNKIVLLSGLGSTLFMTGVIVFVQVVHYPLFADLGAETFRTYHAQHVRRTTYVVMAPMIVELITAFIQMVRPPEGSGFWLTGLGLLAALTTWLATFFVSVPAHDRLALGFETGAHQTLVATNLFRVAAWIVHASVLLLMTARALR